ncbi:MAG: hypothetical protein OCC46_05365, partial [Pseudodesulfovibrio sp.]
MEKSFPLPLDSIPFPLPNLLYAHARVWWVTRSWALNLFAFVRGEYTFKMSKAFSLNFIRDFSRKKR